MALRLRDNLHWCDCGGRAVFLDADADRYFCLPLEANEAFLRLAAQRPLAGDELRLGPLIRRGLLIYGPEPSSIAPPPSVDRPVSDLAADVPFPDLLGIGRALAAEIRAASRLRTMAFSELIQAHRRHKPRRAAAARPDANARQIATAFEATGFLTRSHDRCLVRAFAVHSACRQRGINAQLVFGVIAHPFTAHCWVQLGCEVVVGGYEQARLYTPILVLE